MIGSVTKAENRNVKQYFDGIKKNTHLVSYVEEDVILNRPAGP